MASRVSKTWVAKSDIHVDIKKDKINTNNLANYILSMTHNDVTYDFLMSLFGHFHGNALCNPYDLLEVPANTFRYRNDKGEELTNKNKFITTIGLYIFNLFLSGFNFIRITGYINNNLNDKGYKKIDKKLVYALIEDEITVEEYKQWNNTMEWFAPLQDVISPNHTEKLLLCSKAISKKKAELIKNNQEAIDRGDPKVIEDIEKELLEYAKEYLGDDPYLDTLNSGAGASFNNQFKNMYIIKGAVANPDPNAEKKYDIITSSYVDGVNQTEYSVLASSVANGAYSRGKKTSLGGYWEKLFVAALQHITLDPKGSDCGTKRYLEVELNENNISDYIYSYAVKNDGSTELIDSKNCSKFYGKKTKIRYSSLCESKTGICNKCAGDLLYVTSSKNVGAIAGQIPDKLKNIAMKSFHDSTVTNYTIKDIDALFYND